MSLADVVEFTRQPYIKNGVVGSVLLAVFENLVRSIVQHCDQMQYDLSKIEALSTESSQYQTEMLLVYQNIYMADC